MTTVRVVDGDEVTVKMGDTVIKANQPLSAEQIIAAKDEALRERKERRQSNNQELMDLARGSPVVCPDCRNLGWDQNHRDRIDAETSFPEVCPTCKGKLPLNLRGVALTLHEDVLTVARVFELRAKPATAERIFNKLAASPLWRLVA